MMWQRIRLTRACCVAFMLFACGQPLRAAANADGTHAQARAPRRHTARLPKGSGRPRTPPPPTTAPSVSLLDAAGVKQLLARGPSPNDRPLLVNFWATWCEPCRLEFPDLVKIDADYRARGLEFVAVSTDDPGELKTGVPKFLREVRAQMPVYILNVTDSEPVINSIDPTWGGELPATFLFDRQGKIVFQHKGRINATELRTALDKVLSDELKTGSRFKVQSSKSINRQP